MLDNLCRISVENTSLCKICYKSYLLQKKKYKPIIKTINTNIRNLKAMELV